MFLQMNFNKNKQRFFFTDRHVEDTSKISSSIKPDNAEVVENKKGNFSNLTIFLRVVFIVVILSMLAMYRTLYFNNLSQQ